MLMKGLFKRSFLCLSLLILFITSLWGQTSTYTWIGGSDSSNQLGSYGNKGEESVTNTPSGRFYSVSWKDTFGNLWLFGGSRASSALLNDLWKFDVSKNIWVWVSGSNNLNESGVYGIKGVNSSSNIPGSRNNSIAWSDSYGNLWLFGGQGYDSEGSYGLLNDLWKYNISTNTWSWEGGSNFINRSGVYGTLLITSASNYPGARYYSTSWTDSSGNLWLFGGDGYDKDGNRGRLNDLWKYDPTLNTWAWISGSSVRTSLGVYGTKEVSSLNNVPGSRLGAAAWTGSNGYLWLFGGIGFSDIGSGYLNDLWRFEIATGIWTWMGGSDKVDRPGIYGLKGTYSSTNEPGGRISSATWTDSFGNILLFGGQGMDKNSSSGQLNDFWKFNIADAMWTWLGGNDRIDQPGIYGLLNDGSTTNIPGSRSGSLSWKNASGNFFLFGGYGLDASGNSGSLNDLWKLQALPENNPTNIILSNITITENQPIGTTIGILYATVLDYITNIDMIFELVSGPGSADNASFSVIGSTLKSAIDFDYEKKSSYFIRIRVTDSGGLSYEKQFTITIIDDPTDLTFAPAAQPTNLTFSNISTSSITVNYTAATGNPSAYLIVRKAGALPTFVPVDGTAYDDGATLGDGSVAYNRSNVPFNDMGLTSGTTYYYQIYSYNGSGTSINYLQASPLSGSKATVGINTAPTDINLSASSITENQAIGTTIGTLSATDAEGGTMSYTLVAGTGDPDNALFTISGSLLKSAIVFNYEVKPSPYYSIRVRVTDNGSLTFEKQFIITIIDDPTDPTFEPAAPPTNLTFSNISTSSITLNYTAATGSPSGYLIVRKAAALATFVPEDGTAYADGAALSDGSVAYNRSGFSFNDTGLTSSTTYYYQIYSFNGSGTSINYLEASPLSESQATSADTTPPQITNTTIATQAVGTPVTVSVTVTDAESAVSGVVISYGSSGAAAFSITNAAMTQSGTGWSYTIPGSAITDPGVRYRITAQNAAGLSSVMNDIIGISYSGTGMPIPYTQFGTKRENYRIIAIPLTLSDNSVNAIFGNALGVYGDINKWRMFHYSDGSTKPLSVSSKLERGKGYWLIAAQAATLTTGPGSTAGSLDKPMSIPLTNGWNQIGNPYTYRLAWADIQAANPDLSMGNRLLVFKNESDQLDNGTVLDSFEGGFIFVSNVTSGTSLIFPAERKNGRVEGTRSPSRPEQNEANWEINFELSNGKRTFDAGGFGMYEDGADGFDGYDDFTPPRWGEYLELNHHKNLHQTAYTRDVISTKESHTWEFEVNSSKPEAVHSLTWQPGKLRLAPEMRLVLWDVMRSRPVNMFNHQEVTFALPARFKVIYGDEDYIKRETTTSHFILHPPFPNPNKGKVTVSFQVPEEQDGKGIVLELFDPSGKSIQRVDQFFASGYHEVTWELASQETQTAGVYLTKLTTASGIYIQKIIVIP